EQVDIDRTAVFNTAGAGRTDTRCSFTGCTHAVRVSIQLVVCIGAVLYVDAVVDVIGNAVIIGVRHRDHFLWRHRYGRIYRYRGAQAGRLAVEYGNDTAYRSRRARDGQVCHGLRRHVDTGQLRQGGGTAHVVDYAVTQVQRQRRQHIGRRIVCLG